VIYPTQEKSNWPQTLVSKSYTLDSNTVATSFTFLKTSRLKLTKLFGIATTVIVLNSFNFDNVGGTLFQPPESQASTNTSVYYYFDQSNAFTTAGIKAANITPNYVDGITGPGGLTLEQLAYFISSWGPSVNFTHAGDSNLETFRQDAIRCLVLEQCFVTMNFLRTAVSELGGGHHSPIGGYDSVSDQFLVLDVARYKYAPFWFPASLLFNAMNTTDTTVNKTRGYLLVYMDPYDPTLSLINGIPDQTSGATSVVGSLLLCIVVLFFHLNE